MKKMFQLGIAILFAFSSTWVFASDKSSANNDLSWLKVVNQTEINAGKVAAGKANQASVKKYAAMMIKAHGKNLVQTEALAHKLQIKLSDTKDAADLKAKGKDQLKDLSKLQGKDFDKQYMEDMIKDHREVLSKLDTLISDLDTNSPLKQHLLATREEVKQHLKMAEDTQVVS